MLMAIRRALRRRVVIAFACSSAAVLGPLAIRFGAHAYIGYRSEIHVWNDAEDLFREIANAAPHVMVVDRLDAQSAIDATKLVYEQAINYLLYGNGRDHPNAIAIASDLRVNRELLTLLGDRHHRL